MLTKFCFRDKIKRKEGDILKNIVRLAAMLMAIIFALSACKTNDGESQTTPSAEQTSATTEADKNVHYSDLVCDDVESFAYMNFICKGSVMALNIPLPSNWKVYKVNDTTYKLQRLAEEIGMVCLGESTPYEDGKTEVHSETDTSHKIESVYSVNRYGEEGSYTYKRRVVLSYNDGISDRKVTVDMNYTSIDDDGIRFMRRMAKKWEAIMEPEMNTLSFDMGNGMPKALILGNSFVSTTRIGSIFNEMFDDKGDYFAEAISRPNVSIKDYAKDSYMLSRIESGEFGMLFMCGLFSEDDVTGLEKIYDACKASNTVLVLFPAHNEDRKRIKKAQEKYPELVTIDWKEELTNLIYSGVSKSDLCMNDGPEHSTQLAGYVGAGMIYRAIYGELPPANISIVADEYKLGTNYLKTGSICIAEKSRVFYFTAE